MIELRKETIYVEGDHGRLAMTYTLQAEPCRGAWAGIRHYRL